MISPTKLAAVNKRIGKGRMGKYKLKGSAYEQTLLVYEFKAANRAINQSLKRNQVFYLFHRMNNLFDFEVYTRHKHVL